MNNIPRKISNIIEIMKLAAHVEDFPPEQDRIHLANGTLMLDGTFTEGKPDIVRNRLPVFYRPDTPKPVLDVYKRQEQGDTECHGHNINQIVLHRPLCIFENKFSVHRSCPLP